jgi:2-keto-4-pentenoate hydratase/2-oxohepta-3-ene-1,7-dioic acid hydratase in catechol pathway
MVFERAARHHLGIVTGRGVLDVFAVAQQPPGLPHSVADFYRQGLAALPALAALVATAPDSAWLNEADLHPAPIVPAPGKIVCIGLNYRRHAQETGMPIPTTPILFSKFSDTIAASGDAVPLYPSSAKYDYEAELVVVMGRRAFHVAEADALTYVLGYCNGNDLSARDLQMLTPQWLLGKTLPKFMPVGPYLVTADDIPDPQNLPVRCWLNGQLRQNSSTADMVFSVAQIISYISRFFPLEPGDIISTGTPEGVILGDKEPVWMQPGDEVRVEVGGLGTLSNRLVAP